MKKVLLIVALVLCVAIAGTALAATVYFNANPVSGTISADSSVELTLDGSSTTEEIALVAGQSTIYKIHYGVTVSDTNDANATLTVTLAASNGKTLTGVTAALYSDSTCNTAVNDGENGQYKIEGAGNFAISGINESGDYWVKVSFEGAESEEALTLIGGSMTIEFEQA